jgi:DNA-binding XRE family transcriptional regulator
MNLSELYAKLAQDRRFKDADRRIGDTVVLALHFQVARESARLSRSDLAKETGLRVKDIKAIEDEFRFGNTLAVSLVADRLEGQLQECGVDASRFIVEGGRVSDLPKASTATRSRLPGAINPDQVAIVRRVAAGECSVRDGVRALTKLGLRQPDAEHLLADSDRSDEP